MQKIFIVLCLTTFLFFTNVLAYEKAEAAELAGPVDDYMGAIYSAVMVVSIGALAVGTTTSDWVKDNTTELKNTALETWGLMSADMKRNFMDTVNEAGDMLTISKDWISSLFSNLQTKADPMTGIEFSLGNVSMTGLVGTKVLPKYLYGDVTFSVPDGQIGEYGFKLPDGTIATLTSKSYLIISAGYRVNGRDAMRVELYKQPSVYYMYKDILLTDYNKFFPANTSLNATFPLIAGLLGVTIVPIAGTGGVELEAKENPLLPLKEYYLDNPTLELDIYKPEVTPYSLDGTKLNVDVATGTLTLPDGIPYTGEVEYKIPATTVIPVNGIDTPLVQNPAGDWVNTTTGEMVIPGGEVIPGEVVPGAPTVGINWQPLLINGKELTTKFPFSIPWDVMRQLSVFNAEPQTPVIKVDIAKYLSLDTGSKIINIPMKFDIDFSMFNTLASVIRWFNLILFDIGLILMIRKIMPE